MEDNQIIDLYFARSEAAIAQTAAKYGNYCYRIADNILSSREDAQECVNDTYLAAWNAMPPKRPGILSAFLGKITRNISLDRWKRRAARTRGGGEAALSLEKWSAGSCCAPSTASWMPCRRPGGISSCAATGIWTALRTSAHGSAIPRAR